MYSSAQLSVDEKSLILQKVTAPILIRLVGSMIKHIHFKKTYSGDYRAGKNNRYAVYRNRKGDWRFKDFSEASGLPSDFLGLICHKHLLNPKQQDDYLKMWEIAACLTSQVLAIPRAATAVSVPKAKTRAYKANDDGRKLHVSFRVKYACRNEYLSYVVLSYFRNKIQAPNLQLDDLYQARLFPILSFEHRKGKRYFCSKTDFGFVSISGKNIKLKLPCRPKGKREFCIQWKGNRLYGFNQLPKKGKHLLFCAGETDTFAINHHFNPLGIYGICLGGESFHIPPPLIAHLRKRFQSIHTFFDNDKTGHKAGQRAFDQLGISPILWKEEDKNINDVCDLLQKKGLKRLNNMIRIC